MKRPRYPPLTTELPRHLHARLHAASTVLKKPLDEIVEAALDHYLARVAPDKAEVIDRVASSLVSAAELDGPSGED